MCPLLLHVTSNNIISRELYFSEKFKKLAIHQFSNFPQELIFLNFLFKRNFGRFEKKKIYPKISFSNTLLYFAQHNFYGLSPKSQRVYP